MWGPVFLFALLGLVLMGLPGAIIGGIAGYFVRKQLLLRRFFIHPNPEQQAQVQTAFFKATFVVMGWLAKADGRVNEQEIQQATQLMNRMNLSSAMRQKAIELFNQGKSGLVSVKEILNDFKSSIHSHSLIHVFIEIQLQAAYADGVISPQERHILDEICHILGVSRFTFEMLNRRTQAQYAFYQQGSGYQQKEYYRRQTSAYDRSELVRAYQVLGVSENASDQEIKRAWRKLMSEHHPDKLMSKGLPEEMQAFAKQKTQEIQAAWDLIQKHRKKQA